MPSYLYECPFNECERIDTVFVQRPSLKPEKHFCSKCGTEMVNIKTTAPNVRFKGTGFYETDYKGK